MRRPRLSPKRTRPSPAYSYSRNSCDEDHAINRKKKSQVTDAHGPAGHKHKHLTSMLVARLTSRLRKTLAWRHPLSSTVITTPCSDSSITASCNRRKRGNLIRSWGGDAGGGGETDRPGGASSGRRRAPRPCRGRSPSGRRGPARRRRGLTSTSSSPCRAPHRGFRFARFLSSSRGGASARIKLWPIFFLGPEVAWMELDLGWAAQLIDHASWGLCVSDVDQQIKVH